MRPFTRTEERIMDRIQRDVPLNPAPFAVISRELKLDGNLLMETLRALKERRVVRNISGIFNARRLGYDSGLVAFRVPAAHTEAAAGFINAHPGVSHNYLRDHRFNLWFTLTVGPSVSLSRTVEALAAYCRAEESLVFKNERLYKIGFMLRMGDEDESEDEQEGHSAADTFPAAETGVQPLSTGDKMSIALLQRDLPIVERPFGALLREARSELGEEYLVAAGERLRRHGALRRYAAVLKHYNAGYGANAMTVWKTAGGDAEERAAVVFQDHRGVSHLYRRTIHPPVWEYPLFAMIHARSDAELDEIIKDLSERSGLRDYMVLRSMREFKKERVTYFSPEFDEWNRRYLK